MQKRVDSELLQKLLAEAAESPRKRSHFNLHDSLDAPVQRLLIGLRRGTYIPPHHHTRQKKWELIVAVHGRVLVLLFEASGAIDERLVLAPGEGLQMLEMPPGQWHSLLPLTDTAVIMEVKEGPYLPAKAEDFASWAPAESDSNRVDWLHWAESAEIGDTFRGGL